MLKYLFSSKISIFIILVIVTFSSSNLNWTGGNWEGILLIYPLSSIFKL